MYQKLSNIIAFIFLIIFLSACTERVDFSTPAQSQIDEYTARLKKCKDRKPEDLNDAGKKPGDSSCSDQEIASFQEPTREKEGRFTKDTDVAEKKTADKSGAGSNDHLKFFHVALLDDDASDAPFRIKDTDIILGDPNSHVVVIEYFAPTCHACAAFHARIFDDVKAKYIDTNKIAYIMREIAVTKQDMDAAILARCNRSYDNFIKFINVILAQQDSWLNHKKYREIFTNIGQIGGVAPDAYARCLADKSLFSIISGNTREAGKIPGFSYTPTFFINGKQLDLPYTLENISEAIDKASIKISSLL